MKLLHYSERASWSAPGKGQVHLFYEIERIAMPVSTSSLNIRVTTATDYKTDNTKALQALLQQATHIIIDTVINLSDQVKTSFEGQVIEGTETGEIRPIG